MSNQSSLTKAILFVEEFRKIDPELPMQVALILLLVARKPGTNLKELVQATGLGKSSVSRNIAALSKEHGKGLITYSEDLLDRRNKVCRLTPEGERVVRSLLHYVGEKEAA
ncbi:MarR family winged helix-turn-helix transcriptional regulator [Azorhizobium caulinodans]|uniref:MarR family winged helix-turn-helix transcriptional regulator n=1 Tax=Azorhizobium caulinodans TaxID=7 RepID=UPI0005C4A5F5|nr:MarR family transcriptional regulator [Azorhizobium caulinodans]